MPGTLNVGGHNIITHSGTSGAGTVDADNIDTVNIGNNALVVDSSGNVGVGTSSPDSKIQSISTTAGANSVNFQNTDSGGYGAKFIGGGGASNLYIVDFRDYSGASKLKIDGSGNLLVGITSSTSQGEELQVWRQGGEVASFTRYDDGTLLNFRTGGGAIHGTISISGTTCSYNSFAGSHWSQLKDGSKSEILCGTVMEAIDELVQWPNEPPNTNLCKVKISDNVGTKKVYGVFMGWDKDWTATNDMLVTALGAFLCRVNNSEVVQQGDLLESNGDGTARVQSDDVIRSSTIGKVTSTFKTLEYDDGSYCVPTVLYCG